MRQKTILVIDDEPMIRELFFDSFEIRFGRVFTAKNGAEGWDVLQREHVDIILSDVRMPGGDGVELLKQVGTLKENRPKFCLVTGFADALPEDLYYWGADALFPKPFSIRAIIALMAEIFLPLEERWRLPREFPPSGPILKRKVSLSKGDMGRGGLFFPECTNRREGTIVGFELETSDWPEDRIEGHGIVRWVRTVPDQVRGPSGCGVEILSIAGGGELKIAREIKSLAPNALIPLR